MANDSFGVYHTGNQCLWNISSCSEYRLDGTCKSCRDCSVYDIVLRFSILQWVFLQIYFFIANVWLFVAWSATHEDGKRLAIKRASPQLLIYISTVWILGTYVLGDNLDAFYIAIVRGCMAFWSMFTGETYVYAHKASAYPFLEAYAIVGQVLAMILMIRRYIANWYIWIFINLICIFTFTLKGGYGMALIFGVFTLMFLRDL